VDNCVTSLGDERFVNQFIREATMVMDKRSFELRGWERTHNANLDELELSCSGTKLASTERISKHSWQFL